MLPKFAASPLWQRWLSSCPIVPARLSDLQNGKCSLLVPETRPAPTQIRLSAYLRYEHMLAFLPSAMPHRLKEVGKVILRLHKIGDRGHDALKKVNSNIMPTGV